MQIFVSGVSGSTLCLQSEDGVFTREIKHVIELRTGIPVSEQRLVSGVRELADCDALVSTSGDMFLRFNLRLLGGKGGFGALLRGQGGGHKTTNFDDCRDLNGRRLRHLKNEMKLAEWYAEQKAKELEKRDKPKKRAYEPPKHEWDSTEFVAKTKELEESVVASVEAGFLAAKKLKRTAGDKQRATAASNASSGVSSSSSAPVSSATSSGPRNTVSTDYLWADLADLADDAESTTADALLSAPSSSSSAPTDPKRQQQNGMRHGANGWTSAPANSHASDKSAQEEESDSDSSDSDSDSDSDGEDDGLLNLDLFASAEELEVLGLDDLKLQLTARGLKCGGSLKERAQRLFSVKGLRPDQIDPKLRAAPPKK